VCVQSPTPGPFVKDMLEAGQFFSNRVLKDFKDKCVFLFSVCSSVFIYVFASSCELFLSFILNLS